LLQYPGRESREFGYAHRHKNKVYIRDTSESNKLHGRTAVAIIGWGEEQGVKYWIAAFSWGSDWGEHGYAKIRRGTNEIGIEGVIVYPKPLMPNSLICNDGVPPCKNGGELKADCTCWCPPGTSGRTCSDCSRPCENGGVVDTETCQCECQPGYFGANCEEYVLFQWMTYNGHGTATAKLSWNLHNWHTGAKFVRYANGEAASENFEVARSAKDTFSAMGELFVDYDISTYVSGYPKAFFMAMQIPLGVSVFGVGKGDKWIWLPPAYFNEVRKCLHGGNKPPPEATEICHGAHGL